MSIFPIDFAGVDWLYAAEVFIVFAILNAALVLMFAAALFWKRYPDDFELQISARGSLENLSEGPISRFALQPGDFGFLTLIQAFDGPDL